MKAIAITSGVAKSPEEEIEHVVEVVRALKRYNVPIGVAAYPTRNSTKQLKEAGAVELKYNVETMDREIFDMVCKGLSLDFILESLLDAVAVFGKNRVSTNFIIGLGETDECVREGVEHLAKMGVIPVLRPITIQPLRKDELEATRPSAERLLKLARMTCEISDKYGLRVDVSQTMCLPCTGCDIAPYRDIWFFSSFAALFPSYVQKHTSLLWHTMSAIFPRRCTALICKLLPLRVPPYISDRFSRQGHPRNHARGRQQVFFIIELVSVEDGTVKVRLSGACAGCPMSQFTLVNFVEATLKEKIPEVTIYLIRTPLILLEEGEKII